MRKISFWKMHGASNDFILFDDRKGEFPVDDAGWRRAISDRRTGVGCDGVILVQESGSASFRMRFFNPDGGEAEMCGNGARCAARLAFDIGAAPAAMTIETIAGVLHASIKGEMVLLGMTEPRNWRMSEVVDVNGEAITCSSVNTGVPHAVVLVENLDACDVVRMGAAIRYHKAFAPAGTNANFISVNDDGLVRVRTYERGVEGETLACGTGITASALVAARQGLVSPPVRLQPASGDILTVDFRMEGDTAGDVSLLGPAEYVFTGTLDYKSS